MEGSYPPGVTDRMIAEYFRDDDDWQCCENCWHYNGESCTKLWNNYDESYYLPERDDRDPQDICEDYEYND